MEPNTQPKIVSPMTNKNKKMLIIIAIIILVIIALVLVKPRAKVSAPVDVNGITDSGLQGDNKVLANEIDAATTFDNEADLKEIDKEF